MNKILILLFMVIFMISCKGKSQNAENSNMITLEKIQEMYDNMHSNGVDTDNNMLYGYFFTNSEPNRLEEVSEYLKSDGFEYVNIYPDETGEYWLQLERIESHNANSLFQLNKKLYAVADKFKVTSYDGFDIGNPDRNQPIERDTYAVPDEFITNNIIINKIPFLVVVNKALEQFPHKEEFLYFIEIKTKYSVENASKLPTEKELEELNDFEIFIENNLLKDKISNYYVGRTTYDAERVIYFVTNEENRTNELMNYLKETGKQRNFQYKILEDKEWKIYSDLVKKLE